MAVTSSRFQAAAPDSPQATTWQSFEIIRLFQFGIHGHLVEVVQKYTKEIYQRGAVAKFWPKR